MLWEVEFWPFDPLGQGDGGWGWKVCMQNICYHVASFRNSNKFDMQHVMES